MNPNEAKQIADHAAQQAVATVHHHLNLAAAHHVLSNEFPDLYADQALAGGIGITLRNLKTQVMQEGRPHNDVDLLRQAGHHIREKYTQPSRAPANSSPSPSEGAVSLAQAPSRGNRPESASTRVDPEQANRTAAVQDMMRARHQY